MNFTAQLKALNLIENFVFTYLSFKYISREIKKKKKRNILRFKLKFECNKITKFKRLEIDLGNPLKKKKPIWVDDYRDL